MKLLTLTAIAVALILPASVESLPPGPARITLQARHTSTRQLTRYSAVRIYQLFNRPSYRPQLGTAAIITTDAGGGWITLHGFVQLTRGEIVVDAFASASARYVTFAVAGGTGAYSNVGGTLTLQPVGSGWSLILAVLEAF